MNADQLLSEIECSGGVVTYERDKIRYDVSEKWLKELRAHKDEVLVILRDRLSRDLTSWLQQTCVVSTRCSANPKFLHREFSAWSKFSSTETAFIEELQHLGFALDTHGMVAGVALETDFVAALNVGGQAQPKTIKLTRK